MCKNIHICIHVSTYIFGQEKVKPGSNLQTLMRKNAFCKEDRKAGYAGEASYRTPVLETPPMAMKSMERCLDDGSTPPPVGIQTVFCQL